jgi:hypothetical protein
MMKKEIALVLMSLSGAAVADVRDLPSTVLSCSSVNGRYQSCTVSGGFIVDARLIRQASSTRCIEGETWGIEDAAVWVDKGCRADFRVWYASNVERQRVSCESVNGRYQFCSVPRGSFVIDARVLSQRSNTDCIENETWGYEVDGIWVDQGCRAVFGVDTVRLD